MSKSFFTNFLLLVLFPFFLFAQPHKKTKKRIYKPTPIVDSVNKRDDSAFGFINDTIKVNQPGSANGNIKVIVAKEKDDTDYMNYIFPVITLLLGVALNKGLDYFSDRKKIRKTGKRWIAELSLLEGPITQQIESLNELLEGLKKNIYEIPKLQLYNILEGEVFKTLDKSELLRYIELFRSDGYDDAVKKSNKVTGAVNILTSHYTTLKEKFQLFLQQTSSYNTALTNNLQSLLSAFNGYGVALENELQDVPTNNVRYKPIFDLFNAHIYPKQETGDFDVYFLKDNFFIPLMKILGTLRQDPKTREMAHFANACLNDIHGIKGEKTYMIENAETIKKRYEKELETIPKVLREIA